MEREEIREKREKRGDWREKERRKKGEERR